MNNKNEFEFLIPSFLARVVVVILLVIDLYFLKSAFLIADKINFVQAVEIILAIIILTLLLRNSLRFRKVKINSEIIEVKYLFLSSKNYNGKISDCINFVTYALVNYTFTFGEHNCVLIKLPNGDFINIETGINQRGYGELVSFLRAQNLREIDGGTRLRSFSLRRMKKMLS